VPFGKDYRLALLELDIPELAVQFELAAMVRVSMDSTEDGCKGRPKDSMDWWLLRDAGTDIEPQEWDSTSDEDWFSCRETDMDDEELEQSCVDESAIHPKSYAWVEKPTNNNNNKMLYSIEIWYVSNLYTLSSTHEFSLGLFAEVVEALLFTLSSMFVRLRLCRIGEGVSINWAAFEGPNDRFLRDWGGTSLGGKYWIKSFLKIFPHTHTQRKEDESTLEDEGESTWELTKLTSSRV